MALMSVAAPMSLLMHLSDGASDSPPPELHVLHFNLTGEINDEDLNA